MAVYSERDKGRIAQTMVQKLTDKHRRPPKDVPWIWVTEEWIFSPAFTSLSANAIRALWRIIGEYLRGGRKDNGRLIVTHPDFIAYGVTGRLVADAIDELTYKGLLRVQRGRGADGTPYPNRYRLTFFGDFEGAAPTNEWKGFGPEDVAKWDTLRSQKAEDRAKKAGRKRKSSLHEGEIPRFTNVKFNPLKGRTA